MEFKFQFKSFSFPLVRPLKTSQGLLRQRKGWLLRLEDSAGVCGWGEVSPLNSKDFFLCRELLSRFDLKTTRNRLEEGILIWPAPLAFGIGAALAELGGLVGPYSDLDWLQPPPSAILLSPGNDVLGELDLFLSGSKMRSEPLTFKWKVAVESLEKEIALLHKWADFLPQNARIRLDANGGWNRDEASLWVENLIQEDRLEWIEQPLPVNDLEGMTYLSTQVPIALDESLLEDHSLRQSWLGWQVRRPVIDGDPRKLLIDLSKGSPNRMISTSFETGIGRRWVNHLAALQYKGPTPTAPGLAPGWLPSGGLFSKDPEKVWLAA